MEKCRNDFGLDVTIDSDPSICVICLRCRDVRPILIPEDDAISLEGSRDGLLVGICEPCSYLAAWRWRSISERVATPPFPTSPSVVMVMIVRDRKVTSLVTSSARGDDGAFAAAERKVEMADPVTPQDVLMVTRKDEPGAFALPGGKVEPGEDPLAAAVRELAEETGLVTWSPFLDPLYDGFTARGKLARVYVCRVHSGDPAELEEGVHPEWRPGTPGIHSGSYRGFYSGVELAFAMRLKIQKLSEARVPLCARLGKAGQGYVEMFEGYRLGKGLAARTPDDVQLMSGLRFAMTEEEKMAIDAIIRPIREAQAPVVAAPAPAADDAADDGSGEDDAEDVP